jgi:hypothetical protein
MFKSPRNCREKIPPAILDRQQIGAERGIEAALGALRRAA